MKLLHQLFNWKKNPASVFFIAIPLAAMGFSLLGVQAFVNWQMTKSLVQPLILLTGLTVLFVALIPAYKTHAALNKMEKK